MRQHTSSAQHRAFATDASNYKVLDEMFAKIKREAHLPRAPVLDILPQEEFLELERANFLKEMAAAAAASASASSLPLPEDDYAIPLFGPAAFPTAAPAVAAAAAAPVSTTAPAAAASTAARAGEMMAVDSPMDLVGATTQHAMDAEAEADAAVVEVRPPACAHPATVTETLILTDRWVHPPPARSSPQTPAPLPNAQTEVANVSMELVAPGSPPAEATVLASRRSTTSDGNEEGAIRYRGFLYRKAPDEDETAIGTAQIRPWHVLARGQHPHFALRTRVDGCTGLVSCRLRPLTAGQGIELPGTGPAAGLEGLAAPGSARRRPAVVAGQS